MDIYDNNFYKLLINSPSIGVFEELFSILLSNAVKPREAIGKSTSSCRFWQLFYMLLREYNRITHNQLVADINVIKQNTKSIERNIGMFYEKYNMVNIIFNAILYTPESPLYNIVVKNMNIEGQISPVNNISDLIGANNFCLCVYKPHEFGSGSIDHYFTVFIFDGKYYLNSSYGSELICAPQYTTVLNVDEFNEFCEKIETISTDDASFTAYANFFRTYFGHGAIRIKYDPNYIDIDVLSRFKWKSPEEQVEDEIKTIKQNRSLRKIGLIKNYERFLKEYIEEYILIEEQLGGRERKIKHKKIKRKGTKHKKIKHKSTKRRTIKNKHRKDIN